MKKYVAIVVLGVLLLGLAVGAHAADHWGSWMSAQWARGQSGSTYQGWQFNQFGTPPPGQPMTATTSWNYWAVGWVVLDVTPNNNISMSIWVHCDPLPALKELLYVQVTADSAPLIGPLTSPYPASSVTSPGPTITQGVYETYNWLIEIVPNPITPTLYFEFASGTSFEDVWVDTYSTVPEPASIVILGSCALAAGLSARRRNRPRHR